MSDQSIKSQFLLDQNVSHFNHGSFGACARPVFEEYQRWQTVLESNPLRFMLRHGVTALEESKSALADFIHCDVDDVVYTTNPTYAINIIAKSLNLEPNDEVLSTDLEYGAMDRTWDYYCNKRLAKYKRQPITLPITTKEQFLSDFWKGLTHKTKAVFISHITSSTALRLPVEEICARAKQLGLLTIVDGAHIPGHIPLDLSTLKADIYTGALHKWLLTPKGASFLYVDKSIQDKFDPLMISWGYNADQPGKSKFLDYHTSQGTRDYSAFLTIPKALEFRKENNWEEATAKCRKKIMELYPKFCELLGSQPICPINEQWLGQMCSIPISCEKPPFELQGEIYEKYQMETVVFLHNGQKYLRISLQPYNSDEEINRLMEALKELKAAGVINEPELV